MKLTKEVVDEMNFDHSISCPQSELNLHVTLQSGQSFRWKKFKQSDNWIGVVGDDIWILHHSGDVLKYKIINNDNSDDYHDPDVIHVPKKFKKSHQTINYESKIKEYFHLEYSLEDLYKQFIEKDKQFIEFFPSSQRVRLLRQDPIETLFSFICSSNNNITRISNMVESMCQEFGRFIAEVDGNKYYTFPTVSSLAAKGTESKLKSLGFGYRAKFIHETASKLLKENNGSDMECVDYLLSLRGVEYDVVKRKLMEYPGVGAKVADCICLMSLDKLNVVPVDTHVRQVADKYYKLSIKSKSLTDASYNKIAQFFENLWGPFAGWAQSIAFSGQLKQLTSSTSSLPSSSLSSSSSASTT